MLSIALKGLPRDSYRLMTKYDDFGKEDPRAKLDRFRRELGTEYIDILLIHYLRDPRWTETTKPVQDALSEAKARKTVLAHGVSEHGLPSIRHASPATSGWTWRWSASTTRASMMDNRRVTDLDDMATSNRSWPHLQESTPRAPASSA